MTININNIIRSAGTQFRVETNQDNIEDMMDLIQRDVPFRTPIRLARWNDSLYLVDGFHRVAAYLKLDMIEIPMNRIAIVDANSIEEIRVLAAGANVQHGHSNSRADYHNIIVRLMEFGDTYMKNVFEPDVNKIADAIGAARPAFRKGYSTYAGTTEKPHPTLSVQCKGKRDKAVLEFHAEGMTAYAIAKLCKIKKQDTVQAIIDEYSKNAESAKMEYRESSAPVLTQASTAHREDAIQPDAPWLDEFLCDDEYDEQFLNMTDEELNKEFKPYDVLARTGFKPDDARNNKPAQQQDASNDSVCLSSESSGRNERIAFLRTKIAEYSEELAALLAEGQQAA